MDPRFENFSQPCTQTLGNGRIVDVQSPDSRTTVEFESTQRHCHSGDVVQGGFVAGMLDTAMSMAVIHATDFRSSPASLEMKVSYLAPTRPGVNRAVGWVVKAGRSVAFVEGELYDANGELLAKASSSARLVPRVDR